MLRAARACYRSARAVAITIPATCCSAARWPSRERLEAIFRQALVAARRVTNGRKHTNQQPHHACHHLSNARCITRVTDARSAPDKPSLLR